MTTPLRVERASVVVVGAGPAGLTTAVALATEGVEVVVLEREEVAGGIPRHSDHLGYGIRDLQRFMSGPAYARRLTDRALGAGADLRLQSQVTGGVGERTLEVTSPQGRYLLEADAVVLATGARERPRSARRIPGDRPDGVYTTGQLQNLVHGRHRQAGHQVGRRAVVVGAELVSWSAVMTLREAGCRTVAMTTEYDRSEAYAAFRVVGRTALRVPTMTRAKVVSVNGHSRVESVTVEHLDTGQRATVACDTVVMTGDWVPDNELARSSGMDLDSATLGPAVDFALRTSIPGVFAAGNVIHPVDTADGAALDGRHVATAVTGWLAGAGGSQPQCHLLASDPLRWVTPQRLDPTIGPPRGQLLFWCDRFRRFPRLRATQDGAVVGEVRTAWPAAPGRIFRVPAGLVAAASPQGGDVTIELVS